MSVNSISGPNRNYQAAATTAPSQSNYSAAASSVMPHRFGPQDVLNQYLTQEDRSTIRATTGIDVRANGDILSPVSMGVNEYGSVMDSVGQIAASRASGDLTGSISDDYLQQLMQSFADKIGKNLEEFDNAVNVVA